MPGSLDGGLGDPWPNFGPCGWFLLQKRKTAPNARGDARGGSEGGSASDALEDEIVRPLKDRTVDFNRETDAPIMIPAQVDCGALSEFRPSLGETAKPSGTLRSDKSL